MFKKVSLTMLVLSVLVPNTPCFAQGEISNNQPVRGSMGKNEARIQAKLKADYKRGLIDADQLAQFQRDFDGILDRENAIQSDGMNTSGKKDILKDLTAFEARLDNQANLNKSSNAATTKAKTQ
jgi:hypothetical protein